MKLRGLLASWLFLLWCASSTFAYRDLETGVFLQRDPAGMVNGPNLYTYVKQNPWSAFDPLGLALSLISDSVGEAKAAEAKKQEALKRAEASAEVDRRFANSLQSGIGVPTRFQEWASPFVGDAITGLSKEFADNPFATARIQKLKNIHMEAEHVVSKRAKATTDFFNSPEYAVGGIMLAAYDASLLLATAATPIPGDEALSFARFAQGFNVQKARIPYKFGNTGKALGETDKYGNITIQSGLSGQTLRETVAHEGVHRFFSPRNTGPINTVRANLGVSAYQRSSLVRYIEEGLAEGIATRSFGTGVTYPYRAGYVSPGRVALEATLYGGGTAGAAYGANKLVK